MAGEIAQSYENSGTLYALVFRPSDGYIWDVSSSAFEAVGTWNNTRLDECDIPLSDVNGTMHSADFPAGVDDDGDYFVQVLVQIGGSPDLATDWIISQGGIAWANGEEVTFSTILAADLAVKQVEEPSPETEARRRIYI